MAGFSTLGVALLAGGAFGAGMYLSSRNKKHDEEARRAEQEAMARYANQGARPNADGSNPEAIVPPEERPPDAVLAQSEAVERAEQQAARRRRAAGGNIGGRNRRVGARQVGTVRATTTPKTLIGA